MKSMFCIVTALALVSCSGSPEAPPQKEESRQNEEKQPNGQSKFKSLASREWGSTKEWPKAIESLNNVGKEGWEVILVSDYEFLLRKSGQQWEYKRLAPPRSTLNGGATDNENLFIILDALDQQGWQVCSMSGNMLVKRVIPQTKK